MEKTMHLYSVSPIRFEPFRYASKAILIQLVLLVMVLLHSLTGSAAESSPMDLTNGNGNLAAGGDYINKRNWKSLQGAWGKRSVVDDGQLSAEVTEADDDVYFTERRVPLPLNIGDSPNPILKYSLVYLKNGGGMLDHLLNNDDETVLDSHPNDYMKALYNTEADSNDGNNNMLSNGKRAWKSMNVAWGKRRNAPQWNKFRGAWGKREPGWNNLKGMWGKRTSKDWQKLHGSWGKRTSQNSNDTN